MYATGLGDHRAPGGAGGRDHRPRRVRPAERRTAPTPEQITADKAAARAALWRLLAKRRRETVRLALAVGARRATRATLDAALTGLVAATDALRAAGAAEPALAAALRGRD